MTSTGAGDRTIAQAPPPGVTLDPVDPFSLGGDLLRELYWARAALSRGWLPLDAVNEVLRALDDVEIGQRALASELISEAQRLELDAEVARQLERPPAQTLAEPPELTVHQLDERRLMLTAAGMPAFVGRYRILEQIGQGGMGTIYRAMHPDLDREVALKVIRAAVDSDDVLRFRREARMAAQLEHPGIVRVWDVGRADGTEYIVMDLVEGGELDHMLERRQPSMRERMALMSRVAAAVGHAHRQGIIHRDLKPSNILISRTGLPVVTDFGLARPIHDEHNLTQTNTRLGTPRYMAPEQVRGGDHVGPPADVYALGAVLFEVLTGQPMNPGATIHAIFEWTLSQIPTVPTVFGKALDRDLSTILLKCVEKDPAARYPDGEALAAELERWLAGEPIQARPPGLLKTFERGLPTYFGQAGRATMFAVLFALTPWSAFTLAKKYRVMRPELALQIVSDLMALGVGVVVYLALRSRSRREEGQALLQRRLDAANRELKRAQDRQRAHPTLRSQLLPRSLRRPHGELTLAWGLARRPRRPCTGAAVRPLVELESGQADDRTLRLDADEAAPSSPGEPSRLAFLMLHGAGTERDPMLTVAEAIWRFDSVPVERLQTPAVLAAWLSETLAGEQAEPSLALTCGLIEPDGSVCYAQVGGALPPQRIRAGIVAPLDRQTSRTVRATRRSIWQDRVRLGPTDQLVFLFGAVPGLETQGEAPPSACALTAPFDASAERGSTTSSSSGRLSRLLGAFSATRADDGEADWIGLQLTRGARASETTTRFQPPPAEPESP